MHKSVGTAMKLIQKVRAGLDMFRRKTIDPRAGYDKWASTYDEQPDNLMLTLDHEIISQLLKKINLKDQLVVDIGCGTGRHWDTLFAADPKALIGYDVSKEMLRILNKKYPLAKTHEVKDDNRLDFTETSSVDILISTLAIAHIKEIESAFREWNRVLKPGSDILITDYHPETLARGGDRTFSYQGKTIYIENYVHPLAKIIALAERYGIQVLSLTERLIDETVRHFYEKHKALSLYEKFKGTPIIYGMHLRKVNDIK